VKWGKVMATVTKAYDPENLTLKDALEIIAAKAAKQAAGGGKPAKAAKVKKPAAKTAKKSGKAKA
ncbi:MAG: hypothetical protein KGI97_07925, partial [Alphaproteobacteria bacterium]|nr:hypothetical protein [Alphaproteobacteria bacterium]